MDDPIFLTVQQVLRIHAEQIAEHGGAAGIANMGYIESAVAQASATFDGSFLHCDIYQMAAVYLFFLAKNHGFIEGNKRTAAATAAIFLEINGYDFDADEDEFADLTLGIVEDKIRREDAATFIAEHCHKIEWAE